QRIGGVHVPGAAERVARKLVQQDQQRQRAGRAAFPVIEFTPGGSHVQVQETFAECLVEGRVLAEPALGTRFAPEPDHGVRVVMGLVQDRFPPGLTACRCGEHTLHGGARTSHIAVVRQVSRRIFTRAWRAYLAGMSNDMSKQSWPTSLPRAPRPVS